MGKGAGTMSPATFLPALGPEPWRVGYVERPPSDRQALWGKQQAATYYQYQVILKPSPDVCWSLDGLRAIGIDPDEHDIRRRGQLGIPTLGRLGAGQSG